MTCLNIISDKAFAALFLLFFLAIWLAFHVGCLYMKDSKALDRDEHEDFSGRVG